MRRVHAHRALPAVRARRDRRAPPHHRQALPSRRRRELRRARRRRDARPRCMRRPGHRLAHDLSHDGLQLRLPVLLREPPRRQDESGGAGRRRGARRAHARGLRRSPARRHLVRRRAAAVPRRHRVALRAPDGPRGGEGLHLQGRHHHQRLPARPGCRRHAREGQGRHRAGDHRRPRAHSRRDAAPRGRRRDLRAHHLQPPRPQDPVQGHHQAQRPRGQPCRDGRARGPGQAHGRGVGQPARLLPRAGERLRGGGRPWRAGRAPVRLVRKRGRRPSGGEALCAWQGILLRRLHALERRR